MNPKISIIIPVYNRPTLVARCLESCISQTMAHDNYEIIVVDDCSTDNTVEVIETYSQRYPNLIKTIKLSENSGGASRPRNIGIDNALGEYIFFMDSDDRIHPDLLYDGYSQAIVNNCDLIIVTFYTSLLPHLHKHILSDSNSCLSREDWNYFFVLPGHFFRREQINKLNLRFAENIHGIEDNLFLFAFMFRSFDLRWDIIKGKISYQYNGFISGQPYYFQDRTRKHPDLGTVTAHWSEGNSALTIIEQTLLKIKEDVRLVDKAHLALNFFGNFVERGEFPISVSCRTISETRFLELKYAANNLISSEIESLLSPMMISVINAFRFKSKNELPNIVDSYLAATFQTETNFVNYLCALKIICKDYLILISIKDSSCYGNFKSEYSAISIPFELENLLLNKFWHSYVGIMNDGNIVFQKLDIDSVKFKGNIENISLSLESQGYSSGNSSSIMINDREYSLNCNGFNIVVFDKKTNEVVDAVGFDTRAFNFACFRHQ